MKKFLLITFIAICAETNAQNTWIQKTDFGGAARECAVGFSIGNKGYLGTGFDGGLNWYNDFWEYDPIVNAWTQKANFGGVPRFGAVGFSINNKGYVGTGIDTSFIYLKDFWEYDPAANTWTQKANFGGSPREWGVGFSIGTKGYMGTGDDWNNCPTDFWEYDPLTDTWSQKADFAGPGRSLGVGFSIGNKGYIGTGLNYSGDTCYNDFWEYDVATNIWTQKADFGGIEREGAMGFSIGARGYIGLGQDFCGTGGIDADFWEFNPTLNAWKHRASPIPINDFWAWGVGFSIGNKGYISTGNHYVTTAFTTELFEYTPDTMNANCSANFTLTADTIPHTYIAINYSAGTPPLTYSWDWGDGNISSGATPSHTYAVAGYYTICLLIADVTGCTDTFCYYSLLYRGTSNGTMVTVNVINGITGLNEPVAKERSLSIFPNPATSTIQLTFNTKHNGAVQCEIWNVMGEKVFTSPLALLRKRGETTVQIDVSFLAKGIYVVRFGDGGRWENKKLVVE